MTTDSHKLGNVVALQRVEAEQTPAVAQCRDLVEAEDFRMDTANDPAENRTADEALLVGGLVTLQSAKMSK